MQHCILLPAGLSSSFSRNFNKTLRFSARPRKDHFKNHLRSDQDHLLKNDLRSDQDHIFSKK
jgi:hypothetical protein